MKLDILEFLEHYEQCPCLWDKSSFDYKNRQVRDEAERLLMNVCEITDVKLLRAKIRSIRGTYNNELRKIKKSATTGSGTDDLYKPKLHWFNYAHKFLSKNIEDEPDSETNLDANSECQGDVCENTLNETSPITLDEELLYKSIPSSSQNTTDSYVKIRTIDTTLSKTHKKRLSNSSLLKKSHNFKRYKPGNVTKTTHSKFGDTLRKAVKKLQNATNSVNANEFRVFGQSVGIQLSKFPLLTAVQLQYDIQSLLTQARLRLLTETTLPLEQPTNLMSPSDSISSFMGNTQTIQCYTTDEENSTSENEEENQTETN